MPVRLTRRTMLQLTAFTPALRPLFAQTPADPRKHSTVSLVKGENRRKNVSEALAAIDEQIRPVLRTKKYVAIKVNNVSTTNQLAATHADAIHGILDYLGPRFKGPVYVVESSAGDTMQGFESFRYNQVAAERRSQKVGLIDLNREAEFKAVPLLDYDLHAKAARCAMPPDSWLGRLFACWASPTWFSACSTRALRGTRGAAARQAKSRPKATLSATLNQGSKAGV